MRSPVATGTATLKRSNQFNAAHHPALAVAAEVRPGDGSAAACHLFSFSCLATLIHTHTHTHTQHTRTHALAPSCTTHLVLVGQPPVKHALEVLPHALQL